MNVGGGSPLTSREPRNLVIKKTLGEHIHQVKIFLLIDIIDRIKGGKKWMYKKRSKDLLKVLKKVTKSKLKNSKQNKSTN